MDKYKGIEFGQKLDHSAKMHSVKVVSMIVLLLLLALVIAGFTGNGPVSQHVAGAPGSGAMIITDKYIRYEGPMKIEVLANTEALAVNDSMLDISFPSTYIAHFSVESILPEPERTEISYNRIVYRFAVKDRGEAQRIVFNLRPQGPFKCAEGIVKIEDRTEFLLWHFIYP